MDNKKLTKEEFLNMARRDIINKNKKKDREFKGYMKASRDKSKRQHPIKEGGYKR